jgi:hypothetical protein
MENVLKTDKFGKNFTPFVNWRDRTMQKLKYPA